MASDELLPILCTDHTEALDKANTEPWEEALAKPPPCTVLVKATMELIDTSTYKACAKCQKELLPTCRGSKPFYCPKCNGPKEMQESEDHTRGTVRVINATTTQASPSQLEAKIFNRACQAMKAYENQHDGEAVIFLVELKKKTWNKQVEIIVEDFAPF